TSGNFTGLPAGTYNYSITDVNNCTPATGTLVVGTPAAITITSSSNSPQCQTAGVTITLSGAGGTIGSGYQYSFDGGAYSASNTKTYTVAGTFTIPVSVKDVNGCIANGSITYTVNTPPTITTNPTSTTITYGANTSYTVAATGFEASTYQWQENTGSGWSNITNGGVYSGATTVTLTLTIPTFSMNTYQYRCVVSNSCGASNSNPATLTVNKATLTITANPRNKCEGTTATFAGTEFTSSGLVSGDAITSVTLTSAGAASTATKSPNPNYPIVASAAVGTGLSNYNITYNPGTLTITSPTLLMVPTPAPCNGDLGGAILQATGGGGSPYTFTSNPTTNVTITSGGIMTAPAGVYVITVTDGAGCTKAGTLTISQPTQITGSGAKKSYNGSDLSCATATDGEI
ncbi:MBG domain-containing protein, partial [Arcicella aurantiaca]|uniref:MBG domain-containing protein n=1 Tax=Arcicella aurantiaca TaxID=591202 RepID=UPI0014747A96